MVVALLFLVPQQDPRGLGLPLLALGAADALRTLWAARLVIGAFSSLRLQDAVQHVLLPVILPVVSSIGLILVAATVLAGTTAYLSWMVLIVALLLTSAATDSWDLMLGLARYKVRRAAGAPERGRDTSGVGGLDDGPAPPT